MSARATMTLSAELDGRPGGHVSEQSEQEPEREPEPQPGADSPGAMLARARAARRLDVAEVASRLKFGARQIEALEGDDYAKLPGTTFVRGMIRGYAKLLEIDSQPMLLAFERRHVAAPVAEEAPARRVPFPDGRTRSTRVYLVLCAVLLLAVGLLVYDWQVGIPPLLTASVSEPARVEAPPEEPVAQKPEPVEAPPALQPAPQTAPQPAPQPAPRAAEPEVRAPALPGAARIVLDFQAESWVEIQDRSGKILMSGLNPAGTSRVVEGSAPFAVVIGNASQVRMTYRDAPFDLKPHIKVEVARLNLN